MGLNILKMSPLGEQLNKDTRMGSYEELHSLRKWIICSLEGMKEEDRWSGDWFYTPENMEKTQFPTIVNHSDCDGGYINFEAVGIVNVDNPKQWWCCKQLKYELNQIKNNHYSEMPPGIAEVFDRFYKLTCPTEDEIEDYGGDPIFSIHFT